MGQGGCMRERRSIGFHGECGSPPSTHELDQTQSDVDELWDN